MPCRRRATTNRLVGLTLLLTALSPPLPAAAAPTVVGTAAAGRATVIPAPAVDAYSPVTKVVLVSPINEAGALAKGYSVSSTQTGGCGGGDFDAWSLTCGVGNLRYVACWPLATPGRTWTARAVCLGDPWQHAVVLISTPGQKWDLRDFTKTAPLSVAWGIELTTGLRCLQFFGSTSVVDGKAVRYFCADDKTALLDGTFDYQSTSRWTAGSAVVNYKTLQWHLGPRVTVDEAWFYVDRSRRA